MTQQKICATVKNFVHNLMQLSTSVDILPLLTPDNIIIGENEISLANQTPGAAGQKPGLFPGFSAPEMYHGRFNESGIVYFIGALAATLLNGSVPADAQTRMKSPGPLLQQEGALEDVINHATNLDAATRIGSLQLLWQDLGQVEYGYALQEQQAALEPAPQATSALEEQPSFQQPVIQTDVTTVPEHAFIADALEVQDTPTPIATEPPVAVDVTAALAQPEEAATSAYATPAPLPPQTYGKPALSEQDLPRDETTGDLAFVANQEEPTATGMAQSQPTAEPQAQNLPLYNNWAGSTALAEAEPVAEPLTETTYPVVPQDTLAQASDETLPVTGEYSQPAPPSAEAQAQSLPLYNNYSVDNTWAYTFAPQPDETTAPDAIAPVEQPGEASQPEAMPTAQDLLAQADAEPIPMAEVSSVEATQAYHSMPTAQHVLAQADAEPIPVADALANESNQPLPPSAEEQVQNLPLYSGYSFENGVTADSLLAQTDAEPIPMAEVSSVEATQAYHSVPAAQDLLAQADAEPIPVADVLANENNQPLPPSAEDQAQNLPLYSGYSFENGVTADSLLAQADAEPIPMAEVSSVAATQAYHSVPTAQDLLAQADAEPLPLDTPAIAQEQPLEPSMAPVAAAPVVSPDSISPEAMQADWDAPVMNNFTGPETPTPPYTQPETAAETTAEWSAGKGNFPGPYAAENSFYTAEAPASTLAGAADAPYTQPVVFEDTFAAATEETPAQTAVPEQAADELPQYSDYAPGAGTVPMQLLAYTTPGFVSPLVSNGTTETAPTPLTYEQDIQSYPMYNDYAATETPVPPVYEDTDLPAYSDYAPTYDTEPAFAQEVAVAEAAMPQSEEGLPRYSSYAMDDSFATSIVSAPIPAEETFAQEAVFAGEAAIEPPAQPDDLFAEPALADAAPDEDASQQTKPAKNAKKTKGKEKEIKETSKDKSDKKKKKGSGVLVAALIAVVALVTVFAIYTLVQSNRVESASENHDYATVISTMEMTPWLKASYSDKYEYARAMLLIDQGNEDEGLRILESLGDYADSMEQANKLRYKKAQQLLEQGNLEDSLSMFKRISNYSDSASQVQRIELYLKAPKLATALEQARAYSQLGDFLDSKAKRQTDGTCRRRVPVWAYRLCGKQV